MIEEFKLDRDPNQAEIILLNLYMDSHAMSISATTGKLGSPQLETCLVKDLEVGLDTIHSTKCSPLEEERGNEPTSSGPAHSHFNPHYHELYGHHMSGHQVEGHSYDEYYRPIPLAGYHADEAPWGLAQTLPVLGYNSSVVGYDLPAQGALHVIPDFHISSAFSSAQSSQQVDYFPTGSSNGHLNDPSFYPPLDYGAPLTGLHFDAFPHGASAPEAHQLPRQELITQEQFQQAHGKVMYCRLYRGSLASGIARGTVTDDYPLCNARLTHPDELIQHLKDVRVERLQTLSKYDSGELPAPPQDTLHPVDRLVEHLVRNHNSSDRDARALVSTNRLVCFK
ncbi:hypothetical protein NLJ89_g755 [Agrocybe chaxingu]|uniref:Uncharacterized protein n=1 Tax=Agrocybe chaxingu TaxID=84603 RepID=A0A9W8N194_9AGAR|nr:hypothetical protein NLJ89_g755 [Agrocybe chaxingu]